ncbi:ATP-binding cassette domain-containing protein [Paracoccus cavernae]|uniref:ATP-binding cassette domain-containing protein n=1 Tax=Paracoccus cavernae TaxID=1571207 RepID=A0ABT8D5D0_9RHOB|nr:ATP-binding cassette domain-containing protein [Paracoccus cavernae]
MDRKPLIELKDIRKDYPSGEGVTTVLKGVDLVIREGEMVAIVGASGSGKSTLMNILGCLDRPSSGSYRIAGQEVAQLGPDALAALRRERFGFIFQRYHLLSEFSALGNVEIPAIYAGEAPRTGATARRLCSGVWAWPTGPRIVRHSFPVGSSSASRSRGR